MGHTRTRSAATLQNTCAIHYDRPVIGRFCNGRSLDHRTLRRTNIKRVDAIVKRQVQHVLAHLGLHVGDDLALVMSALCPVEAGTNEAPSVLSKGVKVEAADTHISHMRHLVIAVHPLCMNLRSIAAEADIKTGGIEGQVPQLLAAFLPIRSREAGIAGRRLFYGLAIKRQFPCIFVLDFLSRCCQADTNRRCQNDDELFHAIYSPFFFHKK